MSLFRFLRRKTSKAVAEPAASAFDPKPAADALVSVLETGVADSHGRIRVEDLLTAAAAVTGQSCIAALGEIDPDKHDLPPGQAVFSDAMNALLCHDAKSWDDGALAGSLFGAIRSGAIEAGYDAAAFPPLEGVFSNHAASLNANEDPRKTWGRVALSVGADHLPTLPPLRYAYELRAKTQEIWANLGVKPKDQPAVCATALTTLLGRIRGAIAPATALAIVFETLNGMAKMAPMTPRHMDEFQTRRPA